MATVYLALGSNVGDSRGHIEAALRLLGASIRGLRRAPVYRSKAVGHTDQPDFLNTAARGNTDLTPEELLDFLKDIERRVGRTKTFRFGPREIDIDIILYDDLELESGRLTVPHPAFRERDFVLRPLSDLDPGLKDPLTGRTVSELLEEIRPEDRSIVD